ncbi:hypothetical protein ZHAS_00007288 [Anopheles sinensis]|uniref:Uncharacterized protein n=1 Tax=Anopheles sinensis TaxID=74873 RepID=A0A084VPL5_ANOSI|nr:hypothetical protein ZHAS_00007288 [Anopheles sinensis]
MRTVGGVENIKWEHNSMEDDDDDDDSQMGNSTLAQWPVDCSNILFLGMIGIPDAKSTNTYKGNGQIRLLVSDCYWINASAKRGRSKEGVAGLYWNE